jgi:hypothetical protein
MNKTPNNNDFEELFRLYTESSCNFNKKVEDDEEDEEETLKEEEEVDEEEDDETIEEGLFSRIKSDIGARFDKRNTDIDSRTKDPSKRFERAKLQRIMVAHQNKIDNALSNLATDLVKIGKYDSDTVEEMAKKISNMVKTVLQPLNAGRKLSKRTKSFHKDRGDAAAKYQK